MIDHSSLPEKKIFDGYFSLLMLPEICDFFLPKMRKSSTQRPFRDLNLGGLIRIKQNPQRPLGILKFLLDLPHSCKTGTSVKIFENYRDEYQ